MAPKTAEKAIAGKAPATKAPAAKKVVKKATKGGASKKKTKAVESYKIYIYKVLKQVWFFLTPPTGSGCGNFYRQMPWLNIKWLNIESLVSCEYCCLFPLL